MMPGPATAAKRFGAKPLPVRSRTSVPTGHHPHYQHAGAAKAGHENEEDDEQLMFALVARQMREQQLAGAFYKFFGHGTGH